MKIKLSDIVDHPEFKWANKHVDVKLNLCEIIKTLTGIQPDDSVTTKVYHSLWLLAKKIKATKKGSSHLSSFRREQSKWLEGHILVFEAIVSTNKVII
jgi:hypothetical protein